MEFPFSFEVIKIVGISENIFVKGPSGPKFAVYQQQRLNIPKSIFGISERRY